MRRIGFAAFVLFVAVCSPAHAQDTSVTAKLAGFDAYMNQVLRDWNVPGIGVGVVVKNKLVFAHGYGYRDYGNKLPFTPTTVMPIASNTKLFTVMAMGLLVDEGKIDWDKPVRQFVPSVQFYNDELNASVTVRDMLAHRTGVTRHDMIWYKSPFTRQQLFERLKYLEPSQPLRTTFLYNNLMYGASGYIIELLSGKTWEQFVQARIFQPLGMTSTVFSIDDVIKQPDHGVPFTERRDSDSLYAIPYYREQGAIGPAGAINSNIQDLSHWLITLMNGGRLVTDRSSPETSCRRRWSRPSPCRTPRCKPSDGVSCSTPRTAWVAGPHPTAVTWWPITAATSTAFIRRSRTCLP